MGKSLAVQQLRLEQMSELWVCCLQEGKTNITQGQGTDFILVKHKVFPMG